MSRMESASFSTSIMSGTHPQKSTAASYGAVSSSSAAIPPLAATAASGSCTTCCVRPMVKRSSLIKHHRPARTGSRITSRADASRRSTARCGSSGSSLAITLTSPARRIRRRSTARPGFQRLHWWPCRALRRERPARSTEKSSPSSSYWATIKDSQRFTKRRSSSRELQKTANSTS